VSGMSAFRTTTCGGGDLKRITSSEVNLQGLAPTFTSTAASPAPAPIRLSIREAFYRLVNVEEHPDVLPVSFDTVQARLIAGASWHDRAGTPCSVSEAVDRLQVLGNRSSRPWRQSNEDLRRRQVLHFFIQYMPTALVDGCWLQGGLRVATAHTAVGTSLARLYVHQVRAFIDDPGRHFVAEYRAAFERLGAPLEELTSRSFAQRQDLADESFSLPIFLLGLAQCTRTFPAEIIGLNLAWQYLGLSAFGPDLIHDVCATYALPPLGEGLATPKYLDAGQQSSRAVAEQYIESVEAPHRDEAMRALLRGIGACVGVWNEWIGHVSASAPTGPADPRQEMLDLLWRKAPHASGYHGEKAFGSRRIDEHLDPSRFDGPGLLEELAKSRWVKPGRAERSGFLRHLIKFGGPMLGVFSPVELEIIHRWIDSLPPRGGGADPPPHGTQAVVAGPSPKGPTERPRAFLVGTGWDAAAFRRQSERRYRGCTVRELYYYLVNVEFYPDILPTAERFARDRLERSTAMLQRGERPIPSDHYDPEALERWVFAKHRQQVDSYRPPAVRPPASREAFIEATLQLAPLILIDGGWLQGIASPALIHTVVGRMLFHVLIEELGDGKAAEHHANIYRDLLAAMGEAAPAVDSWEFARWSRLRDSSFDVPTLWLSISCFPRHFLPEILGLNLAVELAGIGGPYMEAIDALRRFGYPTLFVDVHNSADNVAYGHAAWAMNSIKRHMDEVAERQGPHGVDHVWHRVWTGVRATLPQIGLVKLMAHRIGKRLFGQDPAAVPLIFPS